MFREIYDLKKSRYFLVPPRISQLHEECKLEMLTKNVNLKCYN